MKKYSFVFAFLVVVFSTINIMCAKSTPTPHATQAATLDACACNDTAGTYWPTFTPTNNMAAGTVSMMAKDSAHFLKIGNQVTVTGVVQLTGINAADSTLTEFLMDLPMHTNGTLYDLAGTGQAYQNFNPPLSMPVFIRMNGFPHRANFYFYSTWIGSGAIYYSLTYTIK